MEEQKGGGKSHENREFIFTPTFLLAVRQKHFLSLQPANIMSNKS